MKASRLILSILFVTTCFIGFVLCESNGKTTGSDTDSILAEADSGSKTDIKEKIVIDPGGQPVDIPGKFTKDDQENVKEDIQKQEVELKLPNDKPNTDDGNTKTLSNDTPDDKVPSSQSTAEATSNTSTPSDTTAKPLVQENTESSGSATEVKDTDTQQSQDATDAKSQINTDKETIDDKKPETDVQVQPVKFTVISDEEKAKLPRQPESQSEGSDTKLTEEKVQEGQAAQADTQKAGEKPSDKDDNELETFSEYWTKSVMEEEEKSKQAGDLPGPNGSALKQPKRKSNNYASQECGAKILASNPEAENIKGVLNSNKDDYMINPCKARKWFIIELCEPVRLNSVEIASFELFSSQPKNFTVGFSDRYPTKDWKTYGFDTKDERVSQSFSIPEEDVYYKYVKVNITDHYGEEHFCPLTLFKVYGIAVEYDDDYNVPSDDDNDLDTGTLHSEAGEHESPKNLFASAKDTVMKIVKKVLNVEEKGNDKNGTDSAESSNITQETNESISLNISKEGFLLPCVPEVRTTEDITTETPILTEPIQPQPPYHATSTMPQDKIVERRTEAVHVKGDIKPDAIDPAFTIVTKLEDHEQIPSEDKSETLVTLLDSDGDNLQEKVSHCLEDSDRDKMENKDNRKGINNRTEELCSYVQIMMLNRIIHTCALKEFPSTKSDIKGSSFILVSKTVSTEQSTQSSEKTIEGDKTEKMIVSYSTDQPQKSSIVDSLTESIKVELSASSEKNNIISSESSIELSTSSVSMVTQTEQVSPSPSNAIESSSVIASVDEVSKSVESSFGKSSFQDGIRLEPSTSSTPVVDISPQEVTPVLQGTSLSDRQQHTEDKSSVKSDIIDTSVIHSQTEEQKLASGIELSSTGKTCSASADQSSICTTRQPEDVHATPLSAQTTYTEPSTPEKPSKDVVEPIVQENTANNETKEEVKPEKAAPVQKQDLGIVRVPLMPYQKRDPIMRLNNRIKALELNVSLSSRFLDRMSQKFKRQSEDLMKTINKTIGQFENMTRDAEIRERKQQEQISILEAQVQNLSDIVVRLTHKMDSIDKQVTDRQMVWTSIEVVVMIVLFMICLRRGKQVPAQIPPEIQRLLEHMPQQHDLSLNPRRNSFSGIDDKVSSIADVGPLIQKYSSETALAASSNITDNTKKFDPGGSDLHHHGIQSENIKEVPKKKKKKKKSHDNKIPGSSSNQSLTDINSAGLLFGATQGGITLDSENCDILQRSSSHGILTNLSKDINVNNSRENCKKSESVKKVTVGPVSIATSKPPKYPFHNTGNTRNKSHSIDETGSKVKKNGCLTHCQSYGGIQEVPKVKYQFNGYDSKYNDLKTQTNPHRGLMVNGKISKLGKSKHIRAGSADFSVIDKFS